MEFEKKLGILCRKMASIDGTISDAEKSRAISLAKVNEYNVDLFCDGWNNESTDPTELIPLLKSITNEEERNTSFFFCMRMSCADNVLSVKEIARLFTLAETWDWAPAYVALRVAELIRKNPDMKIECVD